MTLAHFILFFIRSRGTEIYGSELKYILRSFCCKDTCWLQYQLLKTLKIILKCSGSFGCVDMYVYATYLLNNTYVLVLNMGFNFVFISEKRFMRVENILNV